MRTVGGSGLGLSISLEDARLHGGWLQVWGQPGAGAQFRLTLPLTAGGDLTSSPLPLRPAVVRRPGAPDVSRRPAAAPAPARSRCCSALLGLLDGARALGDRADHRRAVAGRRRPVGIEPLAPEAGATPEEIVRGFIDAAASVARRHPVARQHLTAEAAEQLVRRATASRSSAPTTPRWPPRRAR